MSIIRQFQVEQKNLNNSRWAQVAQTPLEEGQVRLAVDCFAFTANNVTYGAIGNQFGYWNFFPVTDESWGILPVWGFADVVESRSSEVKTGERLYGYLPMATEFVITPGKISPGRLTDVSEHRQPLPPIYNDLTRLENDPFNAPEMEPHRAIWFPLAGTSFGLHDWLKVNDNKGAETVCLVSASSKTGLALAMLMSENERGPKVVGLTSAGNKQAVMDTGYYDDVVTYDEIDSMSASSPTTIVDFSGNGEVLASLHRHLGENMRHTVIVGASHWDEERRGEGYIEERSELFFMPGYALQRGKETGGQFVKDLSASSARITKAASKWMSLRKAATEPEIEALYADVKDGKIAANVGGIMSFSSLKKGN